jgi:ATPase family associated with various cellular activities (AAA)
MKIVSIGVKITHTLVAIDRERARRTALREFTYEGGAALLHEMIKRISSQPIESFEFIPFNSGEIRTFTECHDYPPNAGDHTNRRPWRISRTIGQTGAELNLTPTLHIGDCTDKLLLIEIPHAPECVVGETALTTYYKVADTKGDNANAWAVVKTEVPHYLGSPLYTSIHDLFNKNHVIIMNLKTVRMMNNSPLIKSLSWESLAESVQAALTREIDKLAGQLPRVIIVPITTNGAIFFDCAQGETAIKLIYDPQQIEGEWVQSKTGHMLGSTQSVTAAVAAGLVEGSHNSLDRYVTAGLHAARKLRETGFTLGMETLPFPVEVVAREARLCLNAPPEDEKTFKLIPIPAGDGRYPANNEVNWSIVKRSLMPFTPGPAKDIRWNSVRTDVFNLVRVGVGTKLLQDVPVVQFGEKNKLTAVLRDEIEELRSVRSLMREYNGRNANKRPLSIAVFGSPGSGKSFAVKAVAESILDSRREFQTLEFNVSQFSAPEQLYEALHQVRDLSLSGKMPLVFFDEFDSDFHGTYGWLRYFLAPMQDGKFTQGQVSHSVGDAVFVFAGGTSHDMHTFRLLAQDAKTAKGPDFLSRLQGYLNIASLNHGEERGVLLGGVLIRRALLLRTILMRMAPGIADGKSGLDIDDSVMKAFLQIREFRFGARSVESILMMSSLHEKTRFEPSSLPPVPQIDLHVDGPEWISLLEGVGGPGETSEATDNFVISW